MLGSIPEFRPINELVALPGSDRSARVRGPQSATRGESPAETAGADPSGQKVENPKREAGLDGLTDEERQIVAKLTQRDREVRAHENAHLAAAGALARGVSFTYETGPDGKRYAVGGEVSIDTSPESDPEATLEKARQIQAAANAPAQPSGQDRAVAAQAARMEQKALLEIAEQARAELETRNRSARARQFEQRSADVVTEGLSLVA